MKCMLTAVVRMQDHGPVCLNESSKYCCYGTQTNVVEQSAVVGRADWLSAFCRHNVHQGRGRLQLCCICNTSLTEPAGQTVLTTARSNFQAHVGHRPPLTRRSQHRGIRHGFYALALHAPVIMFSTRWKCNSCSSVVRQHYVSGKPILCSASEHASREHCHGVTLAHMDMKVAAPLTQRSQGPPACNR